MSHASREDRCADDEDLDAFLNGVLAAPAAQALERHVARCDACRQLLSALARQPRVTAPGAAVRDGDSGAFTQPFDARPDDALVAGGHLGRYRIIRRLGQGGMGVVYAAYDPELDRQVALKVLRDPAARRDHHDRLRHEAQAMARVAHPNVATVHEVGAAGEQLYLAMELVQGRSLDVWLASAPRDWRTIVAPFVAAGEGLAAAHAAGLVHRDFKPENVLVGDDGRVRVVDFGLARASEVTQPPDACATASRLTPTGALVGTPFYMAPEQFRGEPVDARTDQFSFCVALWIALGGAHPFEGEALDSLARGVTRGARRPLPPGALLPRWMRPVLARGLAVAPADRHPSMAALVAALARDPARRRRRAAVAIVPAVAVAVGAIVVNGARSAPTPCQGAERAWIDVWDAPRAATVERAFAASGAPFAAASFARVKLRLDGFTAAWTRTHTDACLATRVRGDQSEALLDARMQCLEGRRRELRAFVDRLATADATTVERAPAAVEGYLDLSACSDRRALQSRARLPDGAARVRLDRLADRVAALEAARVVGGAGAERFAGRALVPEVHALAYRPLEAQLSYALGWLDDDAGDYAAAAADFEAAIWAAEAGRDDERAVAAWTGLMLEVGVRQQRTGDALAMKPRVTALLERLDHRDDLEAWLHLTLAQVVALDAQPAALEREASEAVALFTRAGDADTPALSEALLWVGAAVVERRPADARRSFERALAIRERIYGADHPEYARALDRVASSYYLDDQGARAAELAERVIAIYTRALGPGHPDVARAQHNLAMLRDSLGDPRAALALHRQALATIGTALGATHPEYAEFLTAMADTLEDLGRHDEALATLARALPILEHTLGPMHEQVAQCLIGMARIAYFRGRYAEALASASRALGIRAQIVAADPTRIREPLLFVGWSQLALGAPAKAVAALERAYALRAGGSPGFVAEIEFALARALVAASRERDRAVALAISALTAMIATGQMADEAAEVRRWLARHRAGRARPRQDFRGPGRAGQRAPGGPERDLLHSQP